MGATASLLGCSPPVAARAPPPGALHACALDEDGTLAELRDHDPGTGRRTSQTSFCVEACDDAPIVRKIQARVGNVTGIARGNFEFIQAVKYERGQKYVAHHDNNDQYFGMPMGARVLTFFMYLAAAPNQAGLTGGETNFPDAAVGKKVAPVVGRAVLWPNVLNAEPQQTDQRTVHESLPVESGTKVGANFWIYNYDYRKPWRLGCTG